MKTKKNNSSRSGPILLVLAAGAALGAGVWLHGRNAAVSSPAGPGQLAPTVSLGTPPSRPAEITDGDSAVRKTFVFQVAADDTGAHLQKVPVDLTHDGGASDPDAQTVAALNRMTAENNSPLPAGTRALSCMEKDGVATVDFNSAFVDDFHGGEEAEALAINAIRYTVGEFGARAVQITVGGRKIDSLGGTLGLTHPLPVSPDMPASPSTQTPQQTAQGIAGPP